MRKTPPSIFGTCVKIDENNYINRQNVFNLKIKGEKAGLYTWNWFDN